MGMLLAPAARLHSTSGGSSETELKELAVRPRKLPSASRVVMTVTPVANCDSAWRNCAESKSRASARGELVFIGGLSICTIMPNFGPPVPAAGPALVVAARQRALRYSDPMTTLAGNGV